MKAQARKRAERPSMAPSPTTAPPTAPPRVDILTIGDELLAGDVIDRNSAFMGARCRALGLCVVQIVSVRDREAEIVEALHQAAARSAVCLVSGGLGPTTDDLTAASVAAAAGVELVRHPELVARLEEFFARRGRAVVEANRKQADLPAGCDVLDNPVGTAPGFALEVRGCLVACMPGVPHEMQRMMTEQVEPRLGARFDLSPTVRRIYRAIGSGESSVQERIREVVMQARLGSPGLANVLLHYRAHMPEVLLNFEALAGDDGVRATPEELCTLDAPLTRALEGALYGIGGAGVERRVVDVLRRHGLTLATAESCTGGLVGKLMTDGAGASAVYLGGVVAYANQIKHGLLGVPRAMLEEHGAVSEPVARAMAEAARARLGSDLSVAVTGIAGPGGGTDEKPVGTVHLAVSDATGTIHKRVRLYGNRGTVRRASAVWALKLVWDRLVERGQAHIQELD